MGRTIGSVKKAEKEGFSPRSSQKARFEYIDEITSDQMFLAYGENLSELLVNAALATFGVMYDPSEVKANTHVKVEAVGTTEEQLLYNWLSNLLAEFDVRGIFFADFSIQRIERVKKGNLHAVGKAVGSREPPQLRTLVKGIALHRFALERENGSYRATVVVDI
jgi:SHS2 domain-containing protein